MNSQPSLADLVRLEPLIRDAVSRTGRWLRFTAPLETLFQQSQAQRRLSRYMVISCLALVVFNSFIPTDAMLLPDIYPLTMQVRLGVYSPLVVLAVIWLRHPSAEPFRDEIIIGLIWAAAGTIIFFLLRSRHPNVVHYHTGLVLVMMFGNIVIRLPFWKACFCSAVILVCYGFTLGQVSGLTPELTANAVAVTLTAMLISLVANYQMEMDARRVFAQDLLQELNTLRLEQANADLERLSRLDGLTEIANRRTFDEVFARVWRDAVRNQKPLSLILIDIDAFKPFNDTYGHVEGDRCLQRVAHVLMASLNRPLDLIARYGGEEFVALLPETDAAAALHVAERLRRAVLELDIPHENNPAADMVSLSAGVASLVPVAELPPQRLVQAADRALYRAKQNGRNRVEGAEV